MAQETVESTPTKRISYILKNYNESLKENNLNLLPHQHIILISAHLKLYGTYQHFNDMGYICSNYFKKNVIENKIRFLQIRKKDYIVNGAQHHRLHYLDFV